MKVIQINATCGVGSTGKICVSLSELMTQYGIENYILYSSGNSSYPLGIKFSDDRYIKLQALKSRIYGNYGFNSKIASSKLIEKLEELSPDIVHLHNIHGHDLNLEIIFNYLRRKKLKMIWTFHDCWSFTGYCPYFTISKCDRWETECNNCPQYRKYSWFIDRSNRLFNKKKELFSGLDLTIITPSRWLADLVKKSFLSEYPVKVINNGIDLNVFRPMKSDFRKKHNLLGKFVILGVAFDWDVRKGLDVFIDIAKNLDEKYVIILVGTDRKIDKLLPSGIISIHRTKNQTELAEIYSSADVFVNPTREENYPTVNMEALACGTPVITFRTGGSPEVIDNTCGVVVECNNNESMVTVIKRVCESGTIADEKCLKKATTFSMNDRFKKYINLYESLR